MTPGPALASAGAVTLFLAAWEVVPRAGLVSATSLPPLSRVLVEVVRVIDDPAFLPAVGDSVGRWAAGLGTAVLVGTLLGLAMGRYGLLRGVFDPLLALLAPVPKVALVIPLLLVLGSRMESAQAAETARVTVIALGCLIPVVVSSYHGAAAVPAVLLWTADAARTGPVRRLLTVVLPAAMPQVLSGVRIALAASMFTLIGSEMLIRESGVGAYLFNNYDIGQYTRVWAVAALVSVTGFLLDAGYAASVRRLVPWWEGQV